MRIRNYKWTKNISNLMPCRMVNIALVVYSYVQDSEITY